MKHYFSLILALALALPLFAEAKPVRHEPFTKVIYLATPSGSGSGTSYANAKSMVDADLMTIQPGMVIEHVYAVVDEAVLGTSALNVGDDDDADGYIASADVTLATPGMYAYNPDTRGAYGVDAGGGNAGKYYGAAGKEIKLDVTGALGATGKVRVIIQGYNHSYP